MQKRKITAFLIIAHLISALLYLQFPKELKYNPDYEDYFSLWFFGSEYLFISIISFLKPRRFWLDIFVSHLSARGVLYVLYFSDISPDNIVLRLGFIMVFFFIISTVRLINNVERSIY